MAENPVAGAPRDDGAPTLDELTRAVQWAADHAVYASDDARRPDVLAWLLSRLSSLIADSADLMAIREQCRVVYYPPMSDSTGTYPIEHTMAARKDSWDTIIYALRASARPHLSELIADSERLDALERQVFRATPYGSER